MDAPRLGADDAAVRQVGDDMIGRTLPKAEWTHEAHLGTRLHILSERADSVAERDLPGLICAYDVSPGGVNDGGVTSRRISDVLPGTGRKGEHHLMMFHLARAIEQETVVLGVIAGDRDVGARERDDIRA